jgi:predicted enzyme related to lactoylglutathione lyase
VIFEKLELDRPFILPAFEDNTETREKQMTETNNFGLSTIGQIAVNAHDLERATNFYRDSLGMKHLFSVPPKMAFFDCDGLRLMLSLPEKPEFDHPSSVLYFKVNNIQQAAQTLSDRGVQFVERPLLIANMGAYDLWMAFFRDSENNFLALMSEVAH